MIQLCLNGSGMNGRRPACRQARQEDAVGEQLKDQRVARVQAPGIKDRHRIRIRTEVTRRAGGAVQRGLQMTEDVVMSERLGDQESCVDDRASERQGMPVAI